MNLQKMILCIALVFSPSLSVNGMEAPKRGSRVLARTKLELELKAIEEKFAVNEPLEEGVVSKSLKVLGAAMRCKEAYDLQKRALALYGELVDSERDEALKPAFLAMMQALTDDAYVDSDFVEDLFDVVAPKMVKDQPDFVLSRLSTKYLSQHMPGFQLSMLKALVQAHQQQPNTRNRRIAGMLGGILQGWDAGRFSPADADILFSDMIELAALLKRAGYSSKSFGAKTIPCLQARGQALLAKGRMFSEAVMAAMRELGVA